MIGLFAAEGVRGIANAELTPELAFKTGQAGAVALSEGKQLPRRILIGRDTRVSGDMLEASISAGFCSVGVQVVCLGIIPTPALAYLVKKYKMDAGVMISASREPMEYNGIKFFDSDGRRIKAEAESIIEEYILGKRDIAPFLKTGGDIGRITRSHTALRDYVDHARTTSDVDFGGMKIAIDCANGAAYQCAKLLFKELGADVETINNSPDGANINSGCGMLHPEKLSDFVVSHRCTFGIVLDGDADRVLAIDENGNLLGGDDILILCAHSLEKSGRLCHNTVVATAAGNAELVQRLSALGIDCAQADDGERNVLDVMLKTGCSIGGDSAGHIIFSDFGFTGDGLVTAVQLAAAFKKSGKSALSELAKELRIN